MSKATADESDMGSPEILGVSRGFHGLLLMGNEAFSEMHIVTSPSLKAFYLSIYPLRLFMVLSFDAGLFGNDGWERERGNTSKVARTVSPPGLLCT